MRLLINWFIYAVAIIIAAYILPGVTVSGFVSALLVAIILGLINTFIRPLLIVLTLPINILTLGLFTLVINALLVMLASSITPGFEVANFWRALLFAIFLSIVNGLLHSIAGETARRPV